jgi:hypothetical protein
MRHVYLTASLPELPGAWFALAHNALRNGLAGGWGTGLALLAVTGAIAGLLPGARRARAETTAALGASLALLAGALLYLLGVGTQEWISANGFNVRYSFPPLILLGAAAAVYSVNSMQGVVKTQACRAIGVLCLAALALGVGLRAGWPSLQRVRADLDRTLGVHTEEIIRAGCTHIAGNYTLVWPAVFHVNMVLHERRIPRTVWGISGRSLPTRPLWRSVPGQWRIAALRGDTEVSKYLAMYRVPPIREVEHLKTISVLKLRDGMER